MKKMLYAVGICFGLALLPGIYTQADAQSSSRKKGAIIGTVIGGGTGALLSRDHHRAKNAIIGGVIGGGTGYLYGRHRDKKHGRLPKHHHHH